MFVMERQTAEMAQMRKTAYQNVKMVSDLFELEVKMCKVAASVNLIKCHGYLVLVQWVFFTARSLYPSKGA